MTQRPNRTDSVVHGLRAWARGAYDLEAAVELLVRAFDGRFAQAGQPWIITVARADRTTVRLDAGELVAVGVEGPYSGGERRLLAIAASLLGAHPVQLAEVIPGLDRENTALVLAAIAHANGSHEHSAVAFDADTGAMRLERQPSLYPWPGPDSEVSQP